MRILVFVEQREGSEPVYVVTAGETARDQMPLGTRLNNGASASLELVASAVAEFFREPFIDPMIKRGETIEVRTENLGLPLLKVGGVGRNRVQAAWRLRELTPQEQEEFVSAFWRNYTSPHHTELHVPG